MPDSKNAYSAAVRNLLELFGQLPGIGSRSAERIVFHLLKGNRDSAVQLAGAIVAVKDQVRHCSICQHLTENDPCDICTNPQRDHGIICVVEQPKDVYQIEATGAYNGVYHVLLGRLAPLDGMGPETLTTDALVRRVLETDANGQTVVREVILATNPTMDGDATALLVQQLLAATGVGVSRLARGLPAGAQIEHSNRAILHDALTGRVKM